MKNKIYEKVEHVYEEMVRIRRHLHMYPELSFEEVETASFIADYQSELGLEVQTKVGGNGVVARLRGGKPGKTIAIRADFDALPIQEENDVPYKSKNSGVMHACGHDAHTAIALGIAKTFSEVKSELAGDIVFIHQHAEEVDPGGAKSMIEDGALQNVDAVIATHMENYIPIDHIWYNDGYVLAACDDFKITIKGKGGHAAFPQDSPDVILVSSQIINQLHHITGRKIDPLKSAVITIGAFHSGEVSNIIPASAVMEGTARMFEESVRKDIEKSIRQITEYTCKAHGVDYDIEYIYGYPATKNDSSLNQLLVAEACNVIPKENVLKMEPNMGTEDFSYFSQKVPASYFFIGSANEELRKTHPYHHPQFDIDEKAMLNAAKIMSGSIVEYLKQTAND
ncbi:MULTISPECIES: M20 family metallopeptidase [unclassified Sporosarcina]|uniref:M20 metallopeptidase family protein n=1 Tax=unclassified Sporosarcina TaxID=2647733 RepID=UPI00203E6992|nr:MULTISPECIES: amidohydrolase [unclassified Sporosarcina]GKV67458.1 putative amidohydrolase YhaA [Sporosarcina sp. NCCP-2331]GLB57815.1 putative amidohydrolase YhaA [Sporosarcina sp. NCCP-2378]